MGSRADLLLRQMGVALALLGIAINAIVPTWHVPARQLAQLVNSQISSHPHTRGHNADEHAKGEHVSPHDHPVPGDQNPECQICKGLAAGNYVVLSPAVLVPAPIAFYRLHVGLADDELVESLAIAPRSRGPPRLL